jgi:hemerythrin-like metal-binding protein
MEWEEAYETGLPDIDVLHRHIFVLIQRVSSMDERTNRSGIREVIVELERLTLDHFAREESLMIVNEYPGLAKHVAEHTKLLLEVQSYQGNTAFNAQRLSRVLSNWLMSDILMEDRQLALHVFQIHTRASDVPARTQFISIDGSQEGLRR